MDIEEITKVKFIAVYNNILPEIVMDTTNDDKSNLFCVAAVIRLTKWNKPVFSANTNNM